MLFVVAIWAVRYAVKSNQFEDLDNASQRIILEDRQERRQTIQEHDHSRKDLAKSTVLPSDETAVNHDANPNANFNSKTNVNVNVNETEDNI